MKNIIIYLSASVNTCLGYEPDELIGHSILEIYHNPNSRKILLKQYGKEYKDFMKKTPWRIIPKIF